MQSSLEFLVGLLDQDDPVFVTRDDFDGAHGEAVRAWQAAGFIGRESGAIPAPTCPHCGEGVPYRLGPRFVCNACFSDVDPRHLLAWQVDREAFARHLARGFGLAGEPKRIDAPLWQLGTWRSGGDVLEVFFRTRGVLQPPAEARLGVYRRVLLVYALTRPAEADRLPCRFLSLLEALRPEESWAVADIPGLLRPRGNVRFEEHSGALWVGDALLGEVPPGSKEHAFLACLAGRLDHFIPYRDLKRAVLQAAGSTDATEEATFCQGLKSRIKKKWVPHIDRLLATTNKAEGYRLRGHAEV